MNERIGKLAVEAGAYWDHGDWNMPSSVYFSERDLEKFALLIARECRDIVGKTRDQAIEDEWNIDEAMSTAMYDIDEHFGVEE
jgi:hypothetical protein